MKNDKDHPQLPTMSGGVLHKDITLHDPIMFESEDAMKHSDLLWDQANSEIWPYPLILVTCQVILQVFLRLQF